MPPFFLDRNQQSNSFCIFTPYINPIILQTMKKTMLLFSALIIWSISFAGDDSEKKECKPIARWYIGTGISPNLNFYKTAAGFKQTDPGFTAGLRTEFNLCNYVGVISGINYTRVTFNNRLVVAEVPSPSGEMIKNAEMIKNTVNIFEIPIGIRFRSDCCTKTCSKSGVSVTPVQYLGINTILGYSSSKTYQYNNGTDNFAASEPGFQRITFAPEIGCGFEVQVCDKMKYVVMPKFRYDILKSAKLISSGDLPAYHNFSIEASLSIAL